MEDTICAVSTAPGAGGIAVIRISGPEAIAICNTIFVPRTAGKGLLSQKAYTLRYGSIRRGEELIDEVLIALFRAPHSFTGEDTVEIISLPALVLGSMATRITGSGNFMDSRMMG